MWCSGSGSQWPGGEGKELIGPAVSTVQPSAGRLKPLLILQAIAWHACLICVSALQSKQAKYLDIMKGLVKLCLTGSFWVK